MDIEELCKLCGKYSANKVRLELERHFRSDVRGRWEDDSEGMKKVNHSINHLENENNMIQLEIQSVANIDFD